MMSAASSGGVLSRVTLTASTMAATGSSIASRISSVVMTIVLGRPVTRSRPRISACSSSRAATREPRAIFTSSAVRSPRASEYSFLMKLMMASSSSSPPTRTDCARDDAAERDDRDLGGAAADVDDHVAGGLLHGQPGADGGGHGLLDDVGRLAGAGELGGLLHGALLDAGDARRDADDHAGLRPTSRWCTFWMK